MSRGTRGPVGRAGRGPSGPAGRGPRNRGKGCPLAMVPAVLVLVATVAMGMAACRPPVSHPSPRPVQMTRQEAGVR